VILVQVGIVGTLVALRRFRHLLVLLGALLQASSLASVVSGLALRPRPDGVEILGEWRDSALPSRPVAWLSASLVGLGYVLLPAGRMRNRVKLASAGLVGLFVLAQLYLAVDHPTDIGVSVVLGFSIPVLFFRLLVPNDAYPVVYALHRQTAHLDVTGARGEAIRRAAASSSGCWSSPSNPSDSAGRPARRRCASGWTASRRRTSLPSSMPATTCEPTAGTNSVDPSSTARWRTRRRSRPCAASSSTRTTYCA